MTIFVSFTAAHPVFVYSKNLKLNLKAGIERNVLSSIVTVLQEEIDRRQLELEVKSKKELMQYEYQLNVQLQNATALPSMKDQYIEDRKDGREGMKEASKQQMQKEKLGAQKFESKGNDSLNRGIGLGSFEPR